MRGILFAVALALAAASPAYAFQCPADMTAIDAALQSSQLSDTDRAKVIELRAQGEALHAEGKHQESMDTLAQAKQLLGI
jgi:hypothetical protein